MYAAKARTFVRAVFIQMLSGEASTYPRDSVRSCVSCVLMICHDAEDEWAFDLLYCVAFMVMDKQWLERNASYMEFNVGISSLRSHLCLTPYWLFFL